jgi:hypothetical protein
MKHYEPVPGDAREVQTRDGLTLALGDIRRLVENPYSQSCVAYMRAGQAVHHLQSRTFDELQAEITPST